LVGRALGGMANWKNCRRLLKHLEKRSSHHTGPCFGINGTRMPSCVDTARTSAPAPSPGKEFSFPYGKSFFCTQPPAELDPIRKLADRGSPLKPRNSTWHDYPLSSRERCKNPDKRPDALVFGRDFSVPLPVCPSMPTWFLDVRFLPNPHFRSRRLRPFTGPHPNCGGISDRSRRPENSCGASEPCSPI